MLTGNDGFANLLAMPYGDGLSVAVRNRGQKPIENVAVSMSVDRATDKNRDDYAGRMRLRGIFQPAGVAVNDLVRQAGSGRWVSLVYEQPRGGHDRHRVAGGRRPSARRLGDGRFGRLLRPARRRIQFLSRLSGRRGGHRLALHAVGAGQLRALAGAQAQRRRQAGRSLALFYLKK